MNSNKNTRRSFTSGIAKKYQNKNVFRTGSPFLQLPETVLQFGPGILYRHLSDIANEVSAIREIINGRVVLVRETQSDSNISLQDRDPVISRELSAKKQWPEVLACACNPDLKFIIINKGLVRKDVLKDKINVGPPFSFPGKLLALLFSRFRYFDGALDKGFIIVSSDLDHHSPSAVESIVLELAHLNNLESLFLDWIELANRFYCRYT